MTSTFWRASVLLAALAAGGPPAAAAEGRTVIEALIAEMNPCAGLVTEQFGQRIGIDELEDVRLPEADVALRGDAVTARLSGTLTCRAPEDAILPGNASAAIEAEAGLSLADCAVEGVAVRLSDFGGTFGLALQAFAADLEAALADEARRALESGCRLFSGQS